MVTEAEAKTKWCPFARVVGVFRAANEPAVPGHNRTVFADKGGAVEEKSPAPASCIASQCMAWRWASAFQPAAKEHREGFCGLAGAP